MTSARKLRIVVPHDRRIQLPADIPEGAADVIVLFETRPIGQSTIPAGRGQGMDVGLFEHLDAAIESLTADELAAWEGTVEPPR